MEARRRDAGAWEPLDAGRSGAGAERAGAQSSESHRVGGRAESLGQGPEAAVDARRGGSGAQGPAAAPARTGRSDGFSYLWGAAGGGSEVAGRGAAGRAEAGVGL